MIFAYPINTWA